VNLLDEPTIESQLREQRQKRLDQLAQAKDAAREFESLDAKIKAETAKLNQHLSEIDALKVQRRQLERRAPAAIVAENYLREHPTPWVAARQLAIAKEAKGLHDELEGKSETAAWIRNRLQYPPRGTQEELEVANYRKRLTVVDDEIAKLKARVDELRKEGSHLVQRLLTEAWPDELQEAVPKAAARKR
jgi:hypothetical protein